MIQIYLIQLAPEEQLNGFLDIYDSLDQKTYICLLLHLLPAFIDLSVKSKPRPFFCAWIEKDDNAVEEVNWKAENMEFITFEVRAVLIMIDKQMTAYFKFVCVLAESLHAIE